MTSGSPSFPSIVCPFDQSELEASGDGGGLTCRQGHRYPVRQGIPRLLADQSNYADAFGEQWHEYRTTQLDSHTGTTISKDRLERCFGRELLERLQRRDRWDVLEAGCGAGRFTEVLMQLSGAHVTSTDLSSAVEPNQTNVPQSDRHRVIQCDINQMPFPSEQYDVVSCLGVIQHTKNPEKTIEDLYGQVKPGGWLVIDHYAPSLSRYTKISERLMRPVLKRLSPATGAKATRVLTRMFFPLHRAVRNHRLLQVVLSRFSPLVTYYGSLPELNDRQQYEWAELDTHDSLTDYYKHLRSPRSIRSTLESLGAEEVWVEKGGNGAEARCRKPSRKEVEKVEREPAVAGTAAADSVTRPGVRA